MNNNQQNHEPLLPPTGDYRKLLTYEKAEAIYDITYYFCKNYLQRGDRTIDQMVQAARSGKQNIVEGSAASATEKKRKRLKIKRFQRLPFLIGNILETYPLFTP